MIIQQYIFWPNFLIPHPWQKILIFPGFYWKLYYACYHWEPATYKDILLKRFGFVICDSWKCFKMDCDLWFFLQHDRDSGKYLNFSDRELWFLDFSCDPTRNTHPLYCIYGYFYIWVNWCIWEVERKKIS